MALDAPVVSEADYFNTRSNVFINNRSEFLNFLQEFEERYKERVTHMLEKGETHLIIDLNDLRKFNKEMGRSFLKRPMEYIAPFQAALKTYALENSTGAGVKAPDTDYTIGVEGSFGAHKVTPRQLMARHLSNLVCVEGIVTKCSMVRPKVVRSVHFAEATGETKEVSYHDSTSLTGFPTGSIYPQKDSEGNPYTTEFGLSEYMDHQTVTIQEMPEKAPAGLMPSSVDCILDRDLTDRVKPGDRVQMIGVYRALPNKQGDSTSGIFRAIVIANNVRSIGKDHQRQSETTADDIQQIKKLAKKSNVFDILSRSVAPSIYGHDFIKKAIVLLLLGGVEHNLDNGTHLRGDINMLMVGDPGTAKSQLLRFVLSVAPLAINTTGRGSSGVGLTAAVTQDRETSERRLEAGAMVLADRGVVCIDEFDKMSDADRVAIHEVMEQQTVTIAKAGIHMSLNARCSVVAAANPQYGQYDRSKSPMHNVHLPDSLLSRFDLLFIVLDHVDPEIDRSVSDHVIRNHRYLGKRQADDSDIEEDLKDEEATPVFQKYDRMLHGDRRGKGKLDILSIPFFKKYIEFAKHKKAPVLTTKVCALIREAYVELRTKESKNDKTLPVTARSLETLIRLSSAHAKAHLRKEVEEADVNAALEILNFALHHEVTDKHGDGSDNDSSDSDDDDEDQVMAQSQSQKSRSPRLVPKSKAKSPAKSSRKTSSQTPRRTGKSEAPESPEKSMDPFDFDPNSPQKKRLAERTAKRNAERRLLSSELDDIDEEEDVQEDQDMKILEKELLDDPAMEDPEAADALQSLADVSSTPKRKRKGGSPSPRRRLTPKSPEESGSPPRKARKSVSPTVSAADEAAASGAGSQDGAVEEASSESKQVVVIEASRKKEFMKNLSRGLKANRVDTATKAEVLKMVNEGTEVSFSADEAAALLENLQAENKVMISSDSVTLI